MSADDDRTNDSVRQAVLDAALAMYDRGLVVGTAGNVSGRMPDGTICMTPSSTPYHDLVLDELSIVAVDGEHLAGKAPTTERSLHLECYRRYPEVGGVIHSHPLHASMFAVAREPIPAAIEEVTVYLGGDIPVAEYRTTGTDELGEEVARWVAERSAVLMANHGMLAVGKDPHDALHATEVAERTAEIVWGARLLTATRGGPAGNQPGEVPPDVNANFANVYTFVRGELWPKI